MKLLTLRTQNFARFLPFAALLGIVLFTNPLGNFPLNDDWQYAFPVKSLVEEGRLEFKGVFAPNILLQVAWGSLFCKLFGGFDFTWLRFSTLVAAVVSGAAFYRLVRVAGGEKPSALFAAWSLGLSPLFFSLAFSFMSDVPFLALCLLSLLAFYRHLENQKISWLLAACLWAVGSYCVRQPGILLLPAFAAFFLLEKRLSRQGWAVAAALLFLAAAAWLGMERVLKPALGISENYVPVGERYYAALFHQPLQTLAEWAKKMLKTFICLGFFGLPFLPFFWKKMKRRGLLAPGVWAASLAANGLLLAVLLKTGKLFPFGGNILFNFGLGPELLADTYTLGLPNTPRLPEWAMLALNFAGQLSATLLFLLVARDFAALSASNRRFAWLLVLLNGMYLPLMSVTSFFDRYLLLPAASFFFVLAVLAEPAAPESSGQAFRRFGWKWLPFLAMGAFSILATKDYLSWNRARLRAFEHLVSQGAGIREMDAGYEFNGFYNYHPHRVEKAARSHWWVDDDRWMITFGEVPGCERVREFPYRRWLFFKKDVILVLERHPPPTPPLTPEGEPKN